MTYDQETVRVLYKKLLACYPQAFREQLGESMEQTFDDLCSERKQKTKQGLFGFVLWMFVETAMGITREYILLITQGDSMKNILTNFRSPGIISLVLVFPFIMLELVNRRNFNEGFPIVLFGLMWLLPMIFIVILMPIVRNVQAGNSIIANPIILLLRVAFLALIAWMWVGILIDQMPCFLGVPNCD
jgi:uncharacterized membrane protein